MNDSIVFENIFGRKLSLYKSKKYSQELIIPKVTKMNTPFIKIGLVFKTKTGRNSKIYHYETVSVEEDILALHCYPFIAYEETYGKLRDLVIQSIQPELIKEWRNSWPKAKFGDKQSITKIIVSKGYSLNFFHLDTIYT